MDLMRLARFMCDMKHSSGDGVVLRVCLQIGELCDRSLLTKARTAISWLRAGRAQARFPERTVSLSSPLYPNPEVRMRGASFTLPLYTFMVLYFLVPIYLFRT
jgi:hypothetical protein